MLRQIVVAVLGIVLAVFLTLVYDHYSAYNGHVPKIPLEWWGDKGRKEDDTTVKPFKINVPDEVVYHILLFFLLMQFSNVKNPERMLRPQRARARVCGND